MTARKLDANGYITVERNPISRAGVFQYLGSSISPEAEPGRVYNVYRPPEVLAEAAPTFRLVPLINDHEWLGADGTAPEAKGVHGAIGENVEFDPVDGVLYGDLKIWSETLRDLLDHGKVDLSLGYACEYELAPGISPDGKPYDYVQKSMRGNHIALVDEARCAVAVLDHLVPTCDSMEVAIMAEKVKKPGAASDKKIEAKPTPALDAAEGGEGSMTLEQASAALKELIPLVKAMMGALTGAAAEPDGDEPVVDEDPDADPNPDSGDQPDADLVAMDAKIKTQDAALKKAMDQIEELKKGAFKAVMSEVSKRDKLAERLSHHIGTFDHADMSLAEVAKYGVEKLELQNVQDGHEVTAIDAYLAAKPNNTTQSVTMDSAPRSNVIDGYLAQEA